MSKCTLCPRQCGADREAGELGYCQMGGEIRIARAALHPFEEPPISGSRGSGTVFFCGCSLRCVFCQNKVISRAETEGRAVTPRELSEIFLRLQDEGAPNVNLVTPTHFLPGIREALLLAKDSLRIPVVYNTSGYERVEILQSLEGLVDVYLPDMKYASSELAARYSAAPDYPEVAIKAICEMYRQTGSVVFDEDRLLRRGVVVRHLVLPGSREDSVKVLELLAKHLPTDGILISLMSQYTPEFAADCDFAPLKRRLTTFEYHTVVKAAERLGLDGFIQQRSSASAAYTPDFKNSTV